MDVCGRRGSHVQYMYVHIAPAPGPWLLGLKRVDGEVGDSIRFDVVCCAMRACSVGFAYVRTYAWLAGVLGPGRRMFRALGTFERTCWRVSRMRSEKLVVIHAEQSLAWAMYATC